MKRLDVVMVTAWMIAVTGFAADKPAGKPADKPASGGVGHRLLHYCDPVCQLRSQDMVFALLVETYREFHGYQIENDYANRRQGIDKMQEKRDGLIIVDSSPTMQRLQEIANALAARERELRFARLQVQVDNLATAYNCLRRRDEQATGQPVPSQVDTRNAAAELRQFVIVSPGSLASVDLKKPKSIPATLVLLDTPPVPLPRGQTVEPCTPDDAVLEIEPPEDIGPTKGR